MVSHEYWVKIIPPDLLVMRGCSVLPFLWLGDPAVQHCDTCTRKIPLTHSRKLLNCFHPAVLPFQQMSVAKVILENHGMWSREYQFQKFLSPSFQISQLWLLFLSLGVNQLVYCYFKQSQDYFIKIPRLHIFIQILVQSIHPINYR